jgi:gas vesicle protein
MSYAGPTSRAARTRDLHTMGADSARESRESTSRPTASPTKPASWPAPKPSSRRDTAVFAAGIVLGAALGAGVALLFAPESGAYTRRALVRRGRRVTLRGRDAWDDLRDEFRSAIRDKKRAWRRRRQSRASAADME